MWKASAEGVQLMQNWLDEFGDDELKKRAHQLLKVPFVMFPCGIAGK